MLSGTVTMRSVSACCLLHTVLDHHWPPLQARQHHWHRLMRWTDPKRS
jgi:hypothetical protein